jgi:hypothetical protein
VLLALGLMGQFLLKPLRPWWDESRLLQSAVRHARGEGLTYTAPPTELTQAAYQPMTHWPPVYPLMVSGLMRAGLSAETAAKGINVVALVLGLLGWLGLAGRFLPGMTHRCLFAALLVFASGATDLAGYTTDFLLWAAMPYWFGCMLRARATVGAGRAWAWTLAAAILVAVLIGVRWASVFLAPAGVAAILWPGPKASRWHGRLARAAAYGLAAVVGYAALKRGGGYHSGMSYIPKWEFENLATLYPFEALFSAPLGLRTVLVRAGVAAGSGLPGLAIRAVVPVLCLVFLFAAWRRRPARSVATSDIREMGLLFGLSAASLLAMLSYMAVRFRPDDLTGWSYLAEPRYFQPLYPAAALFWLMTVTALGGVRWLARGAAAVAGLAVACVALGEARGQYHRGRTPDESWELVQQVRGLEARDGVQVVVSDSVADYVVGAGPALVLAESADYARLPTRVSQEADLWVIASPTSKGLGVLRERFNLSVAWVSSGGGYALYHARIGPAGRGACDEGPPTR